MKTAKLLISAALPLVLATAASAGKEDGTLNIAFAEPIEGADIIFDPQSETNLTTLAIQSRLISYDAETREYGGNVAESFRQIDPTTWEFTIRDGLVFHDGSPLTAEDVAYTLNFIADPEVRFRLKTRWAFVEGAEVVDGNMVRLKTKTPYAPILARLANTVVLPSDAHSALEDPSTWGQAPIGSGPYRMASFSSSDGIVLERWEDYQLGPLPEIERIHIRPIPDPQSQIAEMMVGDLDIAIVNSADLAESLGELPGIDLTAVEGLNFYYMLLDAADRSGIEALADERVREAIFRAIDLPTLRTAIVPGSESVDDMARICFPSQVGCPDGGELPEYDPERARELLAEAGYSDGFELTLTTVAHVRQLAEGISGYLREVGIEASVDSKSMVGYRQAQADGEIEALVQNYSHGGLPDAGYALTFLYGSPARDYSGNPEMEQLAEAANASTDPEERTELLRQGYDLMTDRHYILPLGSNPTVFAHSEDVVIDTSMKSDALSPYGATVEMFRWAD